MSKITYKISEEDIVVIIASINKQYFIAIALFMSHSQHGWIKYMYNLKETKESLIYIISI